jgi:macrolide transport system ATP-binding/permease protein
LGKEAAKELGVVGAGTNEVIWLKNRPVTVITLLHASSRDSAAQSKVYLNPAAGLAIGNVQPQYVVRTQIGFPAPLKDATPLALSPDAPGVIDVVTVADLRNLQTGVQSDLGALIGTISLVLLVLACLTAATAMYLSVQSRINEIALRRALGAGKGAIARMFMIEGVIVGTAGGLTGSLVGLIAVLLVSHLEGWSPVIAPSMPVFGIVAGSLTGALAAAYPALIASKADPAIALRA